jgi:hypothetical protein
MKQQYTRRSLMTVGILAAGLAVAGQSASAQTDTTTTTTSTMDRAGVLTTAPTTPKPTTATPDMINEAIQRSHARTERLRTTGTPERFGSEEPFTYDPAR